MLAQVERIEVLEGPEGLLVPHGCPTQRAEDHDPLWALANEPGGPACAKASGWASSTPMRPPGRMWNFWSAAGPVNGGPTVKKRDGWSSTMPSAA